jgi:hypothetical protein
MCVQHKASSRRTVRQEKEPDFIHRQRPRKQGRRTLIKIPWPAIKANSNFMHNQLLPPPSQHSPHQPPPPNTHTHTSPPFSRTLSLVHAFASFFTLPSSIFNTTHHLSTICTSHHHHQPQTPTEPSNHTIAYEFSSRQVILHYTY